MYEMMRQSQPVLYVEPHNIWLVFRYDDVKAVLSDHAAFSSEFHRMGEGAGMGAGGGLGASLIGSDPPRHRRGHPRDVRLLSGDHRPAPSRRH